MAQRFLFAAIFASVLAAAPVFAEPPRGAMGTMPQVEYSADESIQTEDGLMSYHVARTPMKERRDNLKMGDDSTAGMVQIIRRDSKLMWQVMPSEKMYMEMKLGQAPQGKKVVDVDAWTFDETVVGPEVLNGVNTTKYKTIATSTDGKKYGGFTWRTQQGIAVKMDVLYKEGTTTSRMTTELKNLEVGQQDPKLFEVPDGYTKFDMAHMMGGMGNRSRMTPPAPGQRPTATIPSGPEAAPEQAESEAPAETQRPSASDMIRGILGR